MTHVGISRLVAIQGLALADGLRPEVDPGRRADVRAERVARYQTSSTISRTRIRRAHRIDFDSCGRPGGDRLADGASSLQRRRYNRTGKNIFRGDRYTSRSSVSPIAARSRSSSAAQDSGLIS